MALLLLLSFILPFASSSSYKSNVYKYTGCIDECSNSACPSGHRKYTDWIQLGSTDSYGQSYSFCGWVWQERCKCNACAEGYFDSLTDCTACPGGTFQSNYAQTSCDACPSGSRSNSDSASTGCTQCSAGTYAALTTCDACPAGTYSADGAALCGPCSSGKYATGGQANDCNSCGAGRYVTDITANECSTCQAGRYSSGAANALCTPCSAGSYSDAEASQCSACTAGTYSLGDAATCSPCPAGTYSPDGSAACFPCGAGTWSDEGSSGCTACVAGKYRLAQTDGCGVCTAGKYNSEEGRSSCSICSNGKYSALQSETVGATGCTDCEAGKTSLGNAAACDNCESGKYTGSPGATVCSNCDRGTYSTDVEPSVSCMDCADGKSSVGGSSECYDTLTDFSICGEHPVDDHFVDNRCKFYFEQDWTTISEGEDSPFNNTCATTLVCQFEAETAYDTYNLMCSECAEGKIALGYNDVALGSCSSGQYPTKCIDPASLSTCIPEDNLVDHDCEYFYDGRWVEKDGGESSPHPEICTSYSVCSASFETLNSEFWITCSSCADGYLSYVEAVGDDTPGTCTHVDAAGQSHSNVAISFCYSTTEFNVCPATSAGCTYLGEAPFGGERIAQMTAPNYGTCKSFELISKETSTMGGTSHTIACTECKDGLTPGDFFSYNGRRMIGSCYSAAMDSESANYKTCVADNAANDPHGKSVSCNYLSNPPNGTEQWVQVERGESAPTDLYTGCSSFRLCESRTTPTATNMTFMCAVCKDNHTPTYNNATAGTCGSQGNFPSYCDYQGTPTEAPTVAPTPTPTDPPTSAPTPTPTPPVNHVSNFMIWLSNLVTTHFELFLGVLALIIILVGMGIYKCYHRDKFRDRFDSDGERGSSLWSFDARDMDRAMNRQQSGRSGFTQTSNTLRAAGSQELPLMRGGTRGGGGGGALDDDGEEEWIERTDPSGKKYFEHARTRRATWTDHRIKEDASLSIGSGDRGSGGGGSRRGSSSAVNQSRRGSAMAVSLSGVQEDQESRGAASSLAWNENPMRDEEGGGGEGGGGGGEGGRRGSGINAAGLTRTRSNTYGSSKVPVLSKAGIEEAKRKKEKEKAARGGNALPPPPPPPPVGWSRAVDAQGREYYWHNETGATSWTIENCKL
ncbi:hypothetical protein TrVE_jg1560 [Triparma verrucosa]|uniref:WW domain-containing protein n=1 Tax=Triparma verrucosa TaxID=1606542 RepID=A0A9W7KWT6_9STRA|nr:hypothetical protein TrVE_jg1560 [Triparma verrucosa]